MSNQADVHILTAEAIADCCGESSQMGPNVATSLQNLEMVATEQKMSRPERPTKEEIGAEPALTTECQFSHDDCREERKQVNKKKEHLEMGLNKPTLLQRVNALLR